MKINNKLTLFIITLFAFYAFSVPPQSGQLMTKVLENDLEAVAKLLEAGADVNEKDENYGSTPLMMACSYRGYTDMVKLLLKYDPDLNIQSETNGYTALIAAAGHSKEVVELLIEHGADINIKAKDGTTAFIASITGVLSKRITTEVAALLLSKGADINATLSIKGGEGMTSLMMAARNNHLELVKFLVENGADVNAKAKNGSTALSFATEDNYSEVVEYLKSKGAK